jgi:hypothetical protein
MRINLIIFSRTIHFRTKREVLILVYIGPAVLELYYLQKVNSSKIPIEGCDLHDLIVKAG